MPYSTAFDSKMHSLSTGIFRQIPKTYAKVVKIANTSGVEFLAY
jgi:hypothetical protein